MDWISLVVIIGGLIFLLGAMDRGKASEATSKIPLEPCFRCNPGDVHLQRKTQHDWHVRCFSCQASTEPTPLALVAITQWNNVNKALKSSSAATQPLSPPDGTS